MKRRPNILYCHCAYADVVPQDTKRRVLAAIVESGAECIEVADLCELAARKDPSLAEFAASGHAPKERHQNGRRYHLSHGWLPPSKRTVPQSVGVSMISPGTSLTRPVA